jgi:hypothetical protein
MTLAARAVVVATTGLVQGCMVFHLPGCRVDDAVVKSRRMSGRTVAGRADRPCPGVLPSRAGSSLVGRACEHSGDKESLGETKDDEEQKGETTTVDSRSDGRRYGRTDRESARDGVAAEPRARAGRRVSVGMSYSTTSWRPANRSITGEAASMYTTHLDPKTRQIGPWRLSRHHLSRLCLPRSHITTA